MTTTTPASMGEPLSEADRLAEIRSRLDAATPGPWSTEYDSYGDEWWFGGTGAGQNTINFPNGSRAGVLGGDCRAEAELIANAPGDIAYLLERNALLEGQLATAQALHQPLVVDWSTSPKCKASHGAAWVNWPCPDAKALGLDGGGSDA